MIAKLENLGLFTFLWTLPSGEVRWEENFTLVLALERKTISYQVDGEKETKLLDGEPLEELLSH